MGGQCLCGSVEIFSTNVAVEVSNVSVEVDSGLGCRVERNVLSGGGLYFGCSASNASMLLQGLKVTVLSPQSRVADDVRELTPGRMPRNNSNDETVGEGKISDNDTEGIQTLSRPSRR